MYIASVGWNPQILRADMDGKNKIVLANLSSIGQTIIDLVLDIPGLRLFFSDQSNNVIRYIDLISLEVHTLLSGSGLHGPTGLAMLNDTLYWTAHQGGGMYEGFIFEADVTNRTVRMIADGFNKPAGLYAYNSRAPKTPGGYYNYNSILLETLISEVISQDKNGQAKNIITNNF